MWTWCEPLVGFGVRVFNSLPAVATTQSTLPRAPRETTGDRRSSSRGFGRSVVVRLAGVTHASLKADPQNIWVALSCLLLRTYYDHRSKNIFRS